MLAKRGCLGHGLDGLGIQVARPRALGLAVSGGQVAPLALSTRRRSSRLDFAHMLAQRPGGSISAKPSGQSAAKGNTVDLGMCRSGATTWVEHLPQAGDPRVESARLQPMRLGVVRALEAAVAPRSHMIPPKREPAAGGRVRDGRARGYVRLRRVRHFGRDDADVITVVDHLPRSTSPQEACAYSASAIT